MRNCLIILMLPAIAWLGGCTADPLTMDLILVGESLGLEYHLDPSGQLVVSAGGGMIEGEKPRQLYQTQLDRAAMKSLKRVISRSGFLLAGPPEEVALAAGPTMRVEIKLGLWENSMDIRGQSVPSVAKIVGEFNRHLPKKYQVDYSPAPPGRKQPPSGDEQW